jgi:hypothetical protein
MNEAIRRINELVVLTSGQAAGATIQHPCYLTGTPNGVPFNSTVIGGLVNFSGTSNWTACKEFITPLMLRSAQCLTDPKPAFTPSAGLLSHTTALDWQALQAQRRVGVAPLPVINANSSGSTCSIAGQYQPPFSTVFSGQAVRFKAFSAFSYTYESLGLSYTAPLSLLRNTSASFCSLDYTSAGISYPSAQGPYLFEVCIRSVYAETLLVEGYGLDTTSSGVVTVVPSKPGISFALGSMFYEANGLPFSLNRDVPKASSADQTVTIVALGVSLGVAVLGWALSLCFLKRLWLKNVAKKEGLL